MRILKILVLAFLTALVSACGSSKSEFENWKWSQIGVSPIAPRSLGVNAFLWQAALDTLSFLSVKADPYGGVIISDWYSTPNSPNERMKITVYIMDRALRAEGLKVRVFRQERDGTDWKSVLAHSEIERKLEDTILTRARQLRQGDLARKASE